MKREIKEEKGKSSLPILLTVAVVMILIIVTAFFVCRHAMKAETLAWR